MASTRSILNVTRGYYMRYRQAMKGIDNCAFAWVVEGETIRDLTLAEAIAKRIEQAKLQDPLPYYEVPGIFFEPPAAQEKSFFASHALVWEAHDFARKCAAA
jgi:hypothetical protein